MNREDTGRAIATWLKETDLGADDVALSARRISARSRSVRQRRSWRWPLSRRTRIHHVDPAPPTPTQAWGSGSTPVAGSTRLSTGPAWRLVAGSVVLVLGGLLVVAQPWDRQDALVPGVATSPEPDPSPVVSLSPGPATRPAGLIVVGHAAFLGTNSDPARAAGFPVPENSWVTGTGQDVDSIYERLVAARPETDGLVSNQAGQAYAQSSSLLGQVNIALRSVPSPALAIVQTIDNDIRCDGTDPEHVPQLGQALFDALDAITSASPGSRIVVVGAHPVDRWVEFVESNPEFKAILPEGHGRTGWIGTGMCDVFDPNGELVPEHVATLSSIYAAYEAEQERVCGLFPQCFDDGSLDDDYVFKAADWSDWAFLSVEGNANRAERYWPLVAEALGLDP